MGRLSAAQRSRETADSEASVKWNACGRSGGLCLLYSCRRPGRGQVCSFVIMHLKKHDLDQEMEIGSENVLASGVHGCGGECGSDCLKK